MLSLKTKFHVTRDKMTPKVQDSGAKYGDNRKSSLLMLPAENDFMLYS